MNDKTEQLDYIDYRKLWGSPESSFDDLVGGNTSWLDATATDFSAALSAFDVQQPNYEQMFASWQIDIAEPVAGITGGGCNVESSPYKFTIREHHSADAQVEKGDRPSVVIPTDGGCF